MAGLLNGIRPIGASNLTYRIHRGLLGYTVVIYDRSAPFAPRLKYSVRRRPAGT